MIANMAIMKETAPAGRARTLLAVLFLSGSIPAAALADPICAKTPFHATTAPDVGAAEYEIFVSDAMGHRVDRKSNAMSAAHSGSAAMKRHSLLEKVGLVELRFREMVEGFFHSVSPTPGADGANSAERRFKIDFRLEASRGRDGEALCANRVSVMSARKFASANLKIAMPSPQKFDEEKSENAPHAISPVELGAFTVQPVER